MKKVRDDRADYGAAFDSNFMKFCKQMEEDALQKKPKKKKLPESVQIYSEHNIPPRDVANMTQEFMNQVKNTNEEMQQWKYDPLDPNFIWRGCRSVAAVASLLYINAYKYFILLLDVTLYLAE